MKLLFVVNSLDFFISHRLDIAIAAQKEKYQIHIFTFSGGDETIINDKGFKYHKLRFKRNKFNIFNDVFIFIKLFKILYFIRPDIIHLITLKPILYGGIISKIINIKAVIIAFSGLGTIFTKGKKNYYIFRFIVVKLLKIIFSNKGKFKVIFQNTDDQLLIEKFTNLEKHKSLIIRGSGVNLDKFKNLNYINNDLVVSMISRFLINKGINEYIEATNILKKKYPKVIFRLVGSLDSGNPESLSAISLQKLKKNLDLEIIENSKDILKIINQSKIIVLPSYREGLPKVLLEASACERPIVTTNVPGCKDVVIDNITGYIAQPKNSLDLSIKIELLINLNDSNMFKMGINGRKHIEKNFSLEYVVNSHLTLYNEILG